MSDLDPVSVRIREAARKKAAEAPTTLPPEARALIRRMIVDPMRAQRDEAGD